MRALIYWPSAPPEAVERLKERLSSHVETMLCNTKEEAEAAIEQAEIFVGHITTDLLAKGKRLRFVQSTLAGLDHVDLAIAKERGILISKAVNAFYVAELALALILSCMKRITFFDRMAKSGIFPPYSWEFSMGTIRGKKALIIGYGNIGRELARMLEALGAHVIAVRRRPEAGVHGYESLPELIGEADIIAIAVPLTKETEGLIGRELLSRVKRGAVLVNVARGRVIDEGALRDALESGAIACAGLDVWWQRGGYSSIGIHSMSNVIATPHRGGFVAESFLDIAEFAAENVRRFLAGETPLNLADPERGY